jgi:hypothetical protein
MTRLLSDNALVDRLKSAAGWHVPDPVRPVSRRATVSDLFPWRVDGDWNTKFDAMNLPSLVAPHVAADDRITIFAFDANGSEVQRYETTLSPFETTQLDFARDFAGLKGQGSFSCFHDSEALSVLPRSRCWLAERGYVAYRRIGDPLWSYVHGNAHALAAAPGDATPVSVATRTSRPRTYRVQAPFDDCTGFELVYVNPLRHRAALEVRVLDAGRHVIETRQAEVSPRGTASFVFNNAGRKIAMVENDGPRTAWRPVVFKHYESHFDVFHG